MDNMWDDDAWSMESEVVDRHECEPVFVNNWQMGDVKVADWPRRNEYTEVDPYVCELIRHLKDPVKYPVKTKEVADLREVYALKDGVLWAMEDKNGDTVPHEARRLWVPKA